jgi:starch synthase
MTSTRILLVSPELFPYTDFSDQSQIIRELALNLQNKGAEVRVFMPKFGPIKERKHRLHEVIRLSGLNISIGRDNNPLIIKVASLQTAKIQVYFLDNEEFFDRKFYYYDENEKLYSDNDLRMIFFNKGVMELLIKLGWIPDVIHCHGWMSSLVPMLAKTTYKNEPSVKNVKLLYSLYEDQIKQEFGVDFDKKAHINIANDPDLSFLKKPKTEELYKAGVKYADGLVVCSAKTNKEFNTHLKEQSKPYIHINNNEDEENYTKYFDLIKSL